MKDMKDIYNKVESYAVGVDAGGTKTHAVAYDRHGVCLGEAFSGCGNLALSYDDASSAILSTVRELTKTLGRAALEYIAVGAAGTSARSAAERLSRELSDEFEAKNEVMSDAELALNAAFGTHGDGMLVISGTGSAVFLRITGTLSRAGGWGHLLGDGGSAYCTGMAALRLLTVLHDRGEHDEALSSAVLGTLGLGDISELVGYVYAPERTKADIAAVSVAVDRLARSGHAASRDILWKSADLLALDAEAVLRRTRVSHTKAAMYGGQLENSAILREAFEERLSDRLCGDCSVTYLPDVPEPTYAAYRIWRGA